MRIFVVILWLSALLPHSCFSQDTAHLPGNQIRLRQQPMQTFTPQVPQKDKNVPFIPQNFYDNGLGFFCRQGLKLQQVHVPLVFRIGSMDDCNYLEQKPGYVTPAAK